MAYYESKLDFDYVFLSGVNVEVAFEIAENIHKRIPLIFKTSKPFRFAYSEPTEAHTPRNISLEKIYQSELV